MKNLITKVKHSNIPGLIGAFLCVILIAAIIPIQLNCYIFKLPRLSITILFIVLATIPIVSIVYYFIKTGTLAKASNYFIKCKYFESFPVFFYYDDEPLFYRNKDIDSILNKVQPGDILLRRYDNYLDGLILSQTSYYTHAAIYYGYDGEKHQVIHAVGDGVDFEGLDKFAKCDSLVILRFNFDRQELPTQLDPFFTCNNSQRLVNGDDSPMKGAVLNNASEPIKNPIRFIQEDLKDSCPEKRLIAEEELAIYEFLMNQIDTQDRMQLPNEYCLSIVLKVAKISLKKEYDYWFLFTDFSKLSCVEFVWYCYKSLYPFHQVGRRKLYYFSWVKAFVLVPDRFLESEYLDLIYTDHKNIDSSDEGKKQLQDMIKKQHLKFWIFILKLFISLIAIMFVIFTFSKPILK